MTSGVYRDIQGEVLLVGTIEQEETGAPYFLYDEAYLASPEVAPLSFSLPLRSEPFGLDEFRPYFEGLLPEGPVLRRLALSLGINETDWLGMLFRCGLDCIGDVVVDPQAFSGRQGYRELSHEEFVVLAGRPVTQAEAQESSRLSIAGTQNKCGLFHDQRKGMNEGWYLPTGGAPSNFIVKFASDEHPHLVIVEKLCLEAARVCGIAVPPTFLLDVGRPVLCVERFDRVLPSEKNGRELDGLQVPVRLHQEDFSQVFGLLPGSKYAELDPSTAAAVASFIRRRSLRPAYDIEQLARITVFNYLVGNCDNHLKNLSVMHEAHGLRVRLAPAYDLVSTTLFAKYSRRMGMRIGQAEVIDEVRAEDFGLLAGDLGMTKRFIGIVIADLCEKVVDSLRKTGAALGEQGFSVAPYLADDLAEDCAVRLEVLAQVGR